jgi:hypothetical protein
MHVGGSGICTWVAPDTHVGGTGHASKVNECGAAREKCCGGFSSLLSESVKWHTTCTWGGTGGTGVRTWDRRRWHRWSVVLRVRRCTCRRSTLQSCLPHRTWQPTWVQSSPHGYTQPHVVWASSLHIRVSWRSTRPSASPSIAGACADLCNAQRWPTFGWPGMPFDRNRTALVEIKSKPPVTCTVEGERNPP